MLVVTKFGGSSLSCATQFEKVKNIIVADPKRKIVVVSALGKRDSSDTKITDLLYILHAHLKYSVPYQDIWNMIKTRFISIQEELDIKYPIEKDLVTLETELNKNISEEYLVSRGEYLTARLMSHYLGYQFVDAKDLISFNYNGKIDEDLTSKQIKKAFEQYGTIVVPGFYGAYPNGTIKLLSRGGSDVTGSILAKFLNASLYENWTDVSGILAADPRIIKHPKSIKEITYTELRELSYMGASVLHEETVFPVQSLNIPINLKNTNEPNHPGTLIKNVCEDTSNVVTGLAGKTDFISFNISKSHMSNEIGFTRKVLAIFEKYQISIEHIPTGIDSISVIVSKQAVEKCQYEIVTEIKNELDAKVDIDQDIALLAVVGRNMSGHIGLCGAIFETIDEINVNVKVIAQGPSELSIIVGVSKSQYEKTLKALYERLIKE
ncbi:MAG: aspartate kinase [Anaeroplasmataceae bacterium]|nr:aspartate kinase [Anaeroplasmataceae bacterium]